MSFDEPFRRGSWQRTHESYVRSDEYQERLARDIALTDRVKAGYTPAEPSKEQPKPRLIDGSLDTDGQQALGELFMHYQPMVRKVANKFSSLAHNKTSLEAEDLADHGYFGVFHAAVTYDKARGAAFYSHALRTVKGHIKEYVDRNESLIRLPSNVRSQVRKFGRTVWSVYQHRERFPVREQVAEAMGIDTVEADYLAVQEAHTVQMGSIDAGYFNDGRDRHTTFEAGDARWKPINPEASAAREVDIEIVTNEIQRTVQEVLKEKENSEGISEQAAQVIRLRFYGDPETGEYLTIHEVAKKLGISSLQARKLESRTLAIFRDPKTSQRLLDLVA